jgi:regulatory factor X
MYHSHSISQGYNNAPQQPTTEQYNSAATHQNNMPRAVADADEKKKSGSAAATQSNEKELREALNLNIHRSLKDIAKEVSDSERTSRAEKTKQLFAMVWYETTLRQSCLYRRLTMPQAQHVMRDSKDFGTSQHSLRKLCG